jgi:spermidine synthase
MLRSVLVTGSRTAQDERMAWTLLDSVTENDALLELYSKDGMFMIRANGLELMNGFCHDSETALGHLAGELAPTRTPRVLVGGLGLGYTVAALVDVLGERGTITVAELSGAVIDWFHRHVKPSLGPERWRGARIVRADVADLLAAGDQYDVVVLDVDNGPEPLVTAGNAGLYSGAGLKALHASLSERGTALLWSGFRSTSFETCAREAGFAVACERYTRPRADLCHFIYVLTRNCAPHRETPKINHILM